MRVAYYIMNGLSLVFILSFLPAQVNNNRIKTDHPDPKPKTVENNTKEVIATKRDSLYKAVNKDLDVSIELSKKTLEVKEKFVKSREDEQKALNTYINVVDEYMKKSGRTEKIVIRKSLKQQLEAGEVFLDKDSTCSKQKGGFFSKKKCVDWKYSYYLVDNKGNVEKL